MKKDVIIIRALIAIFCFLPFFSSGQTTVIKGKITDAQTGEAIPYVNVYFAQKTNIYTTTNFEGYYTLKTKTPGDTLVVSYTGYKTRKKVIKADSSSYTINFQLRQEVEELKEVTISPGENPAFPIMRKVIKHKKQNDRRSLKAYQYKSYSKNEVAINNITENFRERKVMQEVSALFDSLDRMAGDSGETVLPVFLSESVSNYYYRTNPERERETILASNVKGVGLRDESFFSQIVGSTFKNYNFYENWLPITTKNFVSPIADSWKSYYYYDLLDSVHIDGDRCYKLEVTPKRKQDLAFKGTIWITDSAYALKQIDLEITQSANLNYIENIKIQQFFMQTSAGPWLPEKTRVTVDIGEISDKWAGLLAKSYTSNKEFKVNDPKPPKFYEEGVVLKEDALQHDSTYWEKQRDDTISGTEKHVYSMIDSVQNLPTVKSYVEIANIIVNGYKKVGKVDIGPYLFSYANNDVENHRFRLGFRTNTDFSKKLILNGYLAYGTGDERFKYRAGARYIFSRKDWTVMGASFKKDLDQVGLYSDALTGHNIFYAFSRFGNLVRPFYNTVGKVYFKRELAKGLNQEIRFHHRFFNPVFRFAYKQPGNEAKGTKTNFTNSAVTLKTSYAPDAKYLQKGNRRVKVGTSKWPEFTLTYERGVSGVLGSQFEYNKVDFSVEQEINAGGWGRGEYNLTVGKIFDPVPYPLLQVHIGNESPFFTEVAYNLMNYFEFVSDEYASLRYQHHFDGLLLSRVPLIRKLKWRLLGTANIVAGGAGKKNFELIPEQTANGKSIPGFNSLGDVPYIELGYGIENIFKVGRIDAFHRITYLDNPDVSNFGVKVSLQFIL